MGAQIFLDFFPLPLDDKNNLKMELQREGSPVSAGADPRSSRENL
jgi:hypothetical protein